MSFIQVLPDYIQAFAILAAGGWTYWTFFRQRSNEPATDINVDANFVGAQAGWVVVEVMAILENKSLVRHEYRDFRVNVRYLMPSDELADGDVALFHQLRFPHSIDERIAGRPRFFANSEYINPRQRFQHRYETFVPCEATFVRVHCRFTLGMTRAERLRRWLLHQPPRATTIDSQRVFALPDEVRCTASDHAGVPAFPPRD